MVNKKRSRELDGDGIQVGNSEEIVRHKQKDMNNAPDGVQFRSPAEFFAENKNIAGFDNPGKSLYTTIRELVENGLDAAESQSVLPDIEVFIEELSMSSYQALTSCSLDVTQRSDPTLFKANRSQKKKKTTHSQKKNSVSKTAADSEDSEVDEIAENADDLTTASNIFRVTVKDNGSGMPHDSIPHMMGRVLAGTKYCVRQNRGKFGLGSKMALIWAKMSTGIPIRIHSKQASLLSTSDYTLDIDISKNVPNIIAESRKTAALPFGTTKECSGTRVQLVIEGNWSSYRAKIVQYFRQMAVITPYARFKLQFVSSASSKVSEFTHHETEFHFDSAALSQDPRSFCLQFERRSDQLPPLAVEVKHHPSSVNQLLIKQLISQLDERKSASMSVEKFLSSEFSSITSALAKKLGAELGNNLAQKKVNALNVDDIRQIDALLKMAHFEAPDGSCLSPAGEYNLRLGIMKELQPDMVATHAESADVFEGHPFIVEAGVSLGGVGVKNGISVFRFANRIPLLFEAGNDVVTKTAMKSINWSYYKMSQTQDRIGVFVSVVSTKVPFKGTGKEYIGDDATEIKAAVKRAIVQCCAQLKTKLVRRAELKDRADRKRNLVKYVPNVAFAVSTLWKTVAEYYADNEELDEARESSDDIDRLRLQYRNEPPTEKLLHTQLLKHVEQFDLKQAMEHLSATGRDEAKLEALFPELRSNLEFYSQIYESAVVTQREKADKTQNAEASVNDTGGIIRFQFLRRLQATL
eukprot:CAMPEP_0182449418 /NCGR_PEP_ID=MMETSP1172-20130603/34211_1 /TAXON_ID=708627 /ORGANISM="Timspurckia oligopyrenoides, Strain CCMP3278" /LENGTH=750 /DNA_ID=CAMNT_0024646689 /DNA_START=75 /DNA_END=2327 /DNA_ORIENTATION=-